MNKKKGNKRTKSTDAGQPVFDAPKQDAGRTIENSWIRLADAAKNLGWTLDYMMELGITGKIQICTLAAGWVVELGLFENELVGGPYEDYARPEDWRFTGYGEQVTLEGLITLPPEDLLKIYRDGTVKLEKFDDTRVEVHAAPPGSSGALHAKSSKKGGYAVAREQLFLSSSEMKRISEEKHEEQKAETSPVQKKTFLFMIGVLSGLYANAKKGPFLRNQEVNASYLANKINAECGFGEFPPGGLSERNLRLLIKEGIDVKEAVVAMFDEASEI